MGGHKFDYHVEPKIFLEKDPYWREPSRPIEPEVVRPHATIDLELIRPHATKDLKSEWRREDDYLGQLLGIIERTYLISQGPSYGGELPQGVPADQPFQWRNPQVIAIPQEALDSRMKINDYWRELLFIAREERTHLNELPLKDVRDKPEYNDITKIKSFEREAEDRRRALSRFGKSLEKRLPSAVALTNERRPEKVVIDGVVYQRTDEVVDLDF